MEASKDEGIVGSIFSTIPALWSDLPGRTSSGFFLVAFTGLASVCRTATCGRMIGIERRILLERKWKAPLGGARACVRACVSRAVVCRSR